jgi:hypothetical protein
MDWRLYVDRSRFGSIPKERLFVLQGHIRRKGPTASTIVGELAAHFEREARNEDVQPSYTTRRSGARARRRANTFRLDRACTTFGPPPLPIASGEGPPPPL